MTFVTVSGFFAPSSPKRPLNFVVLKYFLLGLLISNSIESILIIPKILDVLDERRIQSKELQEINIKKEELKELLAEKHREEQGLVKEEEREVKTVLKKVQQSEKEIEAAMKATEEAYEREQERKHASERKTHHKTGHEEDMAEGEEYEDEEEGEEEAKHSKDHHKTAKQHEKEEEQHVTVRKRPQRLETGTNYVAVFMLFYGSTTLCLGMTAIFKESALLLAGLISVSCLGIATLISAGFSIIMILSCCKDILIALLTYKYRDMIVSSDMPLPTAVGVASGAEMGAAYDPVNLQMPQQVSYS